MKGECHVWSTNEHKLSQKSLLVSIAQCQLCSHQQPSFPPRKLRSPKAFDQEWNSGVFGKVMFDRNHRESWLQQYPSLVDNPHKACGFSSELLLRASPWRNTAHHFITMYSLETKLTTANTVNCNLRCPQRISPTQPGNVRLQTYNPRSKLAKMQMASDWGRLYRQAERSCRIGSREFCRTED